MSKNETLKSPGRRAFFKKAGIGAGAAGVVAAGLSGNSAKAEVKPGKDFKQGAYRETEHVKRYYELAAF